MAFTSRHIGHGIGLRTKHFAQHLAAAPPVDSWLDEGWIAAIASARHA